ncbi:RNA polymerase sigma factor [Nocardioides sp.]|uniref:RNA polymerase sigma factor n=1 Tax=Nocardioides sp. TaxID=35761 RepID=UPI002B99DD40|nr:sigma-70 family RNA polymerase sigma factor [Nocardioides sp.]HSX67401.1 sigma-70 family RNA polymerase sigma factor [Nocardioides sp.]
MSPSNPPREECFRRLYAEHFDAVVGFTLRRTNRPEDAADAAADTFLIAWRRLAHVPDYPDTRPWLYGVARRVLANQRRGDARRSTLGTRLRAELPTAVADIAPNAVLDVDVEAALDRMGHRDREVLQLHLWEGLEAREIAEVLGSTSALIRPRLSRARARLRDLLGNDPPPAGHLPNEPRTLSRKEGA